MSTYDDEIDLRPYVKAIRNRWWLITIITVVCAAASFAYTYFQERNYEAVATILLTRSRASLEIANQFPTITEPVDSRSRMEAMISIAKSERMAVQTLDDINQMQPGNGIELEDLKRFVNITSSGDTIQISVTMSDPENAALIANIWAQNAVTAINYAYTEEQLPSEILVSLEPARNEYEQAQSDLESFLIVNQVDILQKQIDETSALLDELVQDRTWEIAYNIRRKQKMEQVINQAEILKELLDTRESSLAAGLGDALAVMRLRVEAFGEIQIDRGPASSTVGRGLPEMPIQDTTIILESSQPDLVFDVQIAELIESVESGQNYQRDLEQIIQHAEDEKTNAEAELLDLSKQSLSAEQDELFTATSSRLRSLQAQLEAEQSDLINMTGNRDLTLEIYQALIRKEAEVRNNLQTSSTITFAGPAVPPVEPTSRGVLRNTAIGAAIGFFLSTIWVMGAVWLRSLDEPGGNSQEIQ